jgi:ABC-2 type transport system ATP-binding protein
MDEAEKLCDRVAVVDHGGIIAQGSPAELIRSLGGDHVVELSLEGNGAASSRAGDAQLDVTPLLALPSVRSARTENGAVQLTVGEPHVARPALLEHFEHVDRKLAGLSTRHASLEDVFVSLTGRRLHEEDAAAKS